MAQPQGTLQDQDVLESPAAGVPTTFKPQNTSRFLHKDTPNHRHPEEAASETSMTPKHGTAPLGASPTPQAGTARGEDAPHREVQVTGYAMVLNITL